MAAIPLWQVFGGPGSWLYRVYDGQRNRLNRRLVAWLAAAARLGTDSRVVECGSGPGYASSCFAVEQRVRVSVALDIDPSALREARRRAPSLSVVVGDLHVLPFKDGTVDLAWSNSTLEHLEAPASVLREMARVVRSGGTVFVGVPYRYGPFWFQPLIKQTQVGIWLGRVFNRAELVQLATDAGLLVGETIVYYGRCFVGVLARKAGDEYKRG